VAYQMAPLPVTVSDLDGHFCCLKPFCFTYRGKYNLLSVICLHMNWKAYCTWLVISTINYLFENEGLPKVTAGHVRCKCGNIWKMEQIKSLVLQTTNSK